MVNSEQINAFINYNYIPFDKKQCIKRLLIIWIASTILCFIRKPVLLWVLLLGIVDLLLSIVFIALVVRYSQLQISRYLCDGLFYLWMAVILNLASYRVMTLLIDPNWLLAIILMGLLILCIAIFVLVTFLNIKSEKFSETGAPRKLLFLPFFSGAIGIMVARILLQGQSQEEMLTFVSYILLILSFILGIASINLLKAILYNKVTLRED